VIAAEGLGVLLWAALGLVGAWSLVTGHKMAGGLPRGIKEGWGLRVFGGAYLMMGALMIYEASQGSFGIVFTYAFFGVGGTIAWQEWRKARA
jgi:hypothetical protein